MRVVKLVSSSSSLDEEAGGTMVLRPKACITSHSPASGAVIHQVPWKLALFLFYYFILCCFSASVILTSSDGGDFTLF